MSYAEQLFLAEEIGRQIKIKSSQSLTSQSSSQTMINPPINVKEMRPTTAHIINHHVKADTWTEIKFPRNAKAWQMSCRDNFNIEYCFEPSASTYKTLRAGAIVSEDTSPNTDINAVYVRCANATIVEIELLL